MALSQVSEERKGCLKELKGLLDNQRVSFEQAERGERDDRRAARKDQPAAVDEEMVADEAMFLERLDAFAQLQQRIGDVGDSLLARTRKDTVKATMKKLTMEKEAAETKLSELELAHEESLRELESLQSVQAG